MPDHPAVDMWRRRFRLNLSTSWKRDVEITVKDLDLWKKILDNWFYLKNGKKIKKSPGIKQLLDEYERRAFDANRERESVNREHGEQRLSERSYSPMFTMRRSASGWKG